jgi:Mg/Co/Ni transporter MgtE
MLLEQGNLQGAKQVLVPVQPVDIADAIEGLPEAMQVIAFRLLSKAEAIEVYEYLDSSVQQALIEEFKRQDVLDIVDYPQKLSGVWLNNLAQKNAKRQRCYWVTKRTQQGGL